VAVETPQAYSGAGPDATWLLLMDFETTCEKILKNRKKRLSKLVYN